MAADGTTDKGVEPTRPAPYRQQLADQGRGDMVPENRAANDRFERNSRARQQQQIQPSTVRSAQGQVPGQGDKKELSFGADRQPNRQPISRAQLKQEQAQAATKGDGPQQGGKKELSFGADRRPNRQQISHAQLKQEQAKATVKSDGPQQGDKKELSFGPGRGQGQSQGQDQGLGR